jgi:hypothetical protein
MRMDGQTRRANSRFSQLYERAYKADNVVKTHTRKWGEKKKSNES